MSTQFRNAMTDELVGTRWCSREGVAFDFGANTGRVMDLAFACAEGQTFLDESDSSWAGAEMWALVESCAWTFGEFGGTMEVGSGDLAWFEGL